MNKMSEEDMNKLADIILKKILEGQDQRDVKFKQDMINLAKENPGVEFEITTANVSESQIEQINIELESLEYKLTMAVEDENYLLAEDLNNKINFIKSKYDI
tara:strand:+ start:856 stop:1161 length:306 start_codon:yes stop_codon:yes gene_type:complete